LLLDVIITASDVEKARETIAKKREAEEKELEGKTTPETNKMAAFARSLRNTERKRGSEKTAEVAERQDTWRILSCSLDFRSLWRMAVRSTLNSAAIHQSHKSIAGALRILHE
jgi:hypothetical protein